MSRALTPVVGEHPSKQPVDAGFGLSAVGVAPFEKHLGKSPPARQAAPLRRHGICERDEPQVAQPRGRGIGGGKSAVRIVDVHVCSIW